MCVCVFDRGRYSGWQFLKHAPKDNRTVCVCVCVCVCFKANKQHTRSRTLCEKLSFLFFFNVALSEISKEQTWLDYLCFFFRKLTHILCFKLKNKQNSDARQRLLLRRGSAELRSVRITRPKERIMQERPEFYSWTDDKCAGLAWKHECAHFKYLHLNRLQPQNDKYHKQHVRIYPSGSETWRQTGRNIKICVIFSFIWGTRTSFDMMRLKMYIDAHLMYQYVNICRSSEPAGGLKCPPEEKLHPVNLLSVGESTSRRSNLFN